MPDASILLFVLFFVAFWCAICLAISRLGGWHVLAEHYRAGRPFAGERWRFSSASLGWVNYNKCLTLGANTEGLFLSAQFPFQLGHPSLFIPWSEVESAAHQRAWFFPMVRVLFRRAPSVPVKIPRKLALEIARRAYGRFSIAEAAGT